jgi:hypothetical protein
MKYLLKNSPISIEVEFLDEATVRVIFRNDGSIFDIYEVKHSVGLQAGIRHIVMFFGAMYFDYDDASLDRLLLGLA